MKLRKIIEKNYGKPRKTKKIVEFPKRKNVWKITKKKGFVEIDTKTILRKLKKKKLSSVTQFMNDSKEN